MLWSEIKSLLEREIDKGKAVKEALLRIAEEIDEIKEQLEYKGDFKDD